MCFDDYSSPKSVRAFSDFFARPYRGMGERVFSIVVKNSTTIYRWSGRARSYNSGTSSLWRVPECVYDVGFVKLLKCHLNVFFCTRPYAHGAADHVTYEFHSDGYRCEPPERSKRRILHVYRISNQTARLHVLRIDNWTRGAVERTESAIRLQDRPRK